MPVTVTIDGHEAPLDHLWVPEMSLSSARANRESALYIVSVDEETLLAALGAAYEQFVREGREDDAQVGVNDAVGRAGYPPLDAIIRDPGLRGEVLRGYLGNELLRAVLPLAAGPMHGTWAIDTIDAAEFDGERIILTGVAYAF